jgi:hypothetical protein
MYTHERTREQSTTEVILTQSSFFGTLSNICFLEQARTFQKPAPFPFSSKGAPNLVHPLHQAILSHRLPHKQ